MNIDKYVFAQLVSFLDRSKFNRIVKKYDGDKYVKYFTCWNQLLVMMFAQLTKQDSLRTTSLTIESLGTMCYHLGFGKGVTRSNLSKANQERYYHIFDEFDGEEKIVDAVEPGDEGWKDYYTFEFSTRLLHT